MDDLTFSDYRKLEFELSGNLNRLLDVAEKVDDSASNELIEGVLKRIHEHSFSIAVVGEFKRGKSTLINALLGKEILPADIAPTSATINRITYGLTPNIDIVYRNEQAGRRQWENTNIHR